MYTIHACRIVGWSTKDIYVNVKIILIWILLLQYYIALKCWNTGRTRATSQHLGTRNFSHLLAHLLNKSVLLIWERFHLFLNKLFHTELKIEYSPCSVTFSLAQSPASVGVAVPVPELKPEPHFFVSCESLSSIIHPSLHIKYTQQSYVNSNCSTT